MCWELFQTEYSQAPLKLAVAKVSQKMNYFNERYSDVIKKGYLTSFFHHQLICQPRDDGGPFTVSMSPFFWFAADSSKQQQQQWKLNKPSDILRSCVNGSVRMKELKAYQV